MNSEKFPLFTWDEIAQHDTPQSAWIVIHGMVYDVTHWIPKHPGGGIIYDGAGGDCTPHWESYHPLSLVQQGPPKKYLIGVVQDYEPRHTFSSSKFYYTLKERVEAILPKKMRRSHWVMWLKVCILLTLTVWRVLHYVTYNSPIDAILVGLLFSQIGVNVMHDANHLALSDSPTLSRLIGLSLDLIGGSSIGFIRSHNFGHHGYVNDLELDKAYANTFPIFRMEERFPLFKGHRFQQFYALPVYAINNLFVMFSQLERIADRSNYPYRRSHLSPVVKFLNFCAYLFHLTICLFLPSYLHGFLQAFPIWILLHLVFSLGYVVLFAINHWTEPVLLQPQKCSNSGLQDWAKEQVESSTNFGATSWLTTQLTGGLNLQTEHHLFPAYVHTRLPEISEIVKKTCMEFQISYKQFPSLWGACVSHLKLLTRMGIEIKQD